MQTRRNHCHKCNIGKKQGTGSPCTLLDPPHTSSLGLCKNKATKSGSCGNQSCKYSHRVPRHMELAFCWVFMRGECLKPNCTRPHMTFPKVNLKFIQLLNSLRKNCKKCGRREASPLTHTERSYSRMSITVDNVPDDSDTNEEPRREVEFSPSEPAALKIRMLASNSRSETRTESQDSWTRDMSELEERIKHKASKNIVDTSIITNEQEGHSGSPSLVISEERRHRERGYSRSRSPLNRYRMEKRRTVERRYSRSRSPLAQYYTEEADKRSRSPYSKHERGGDRNRSRAKATRRHIQQQYSRSPSTSIIFNYENAEKEHSQRKYSRSRSPHYFSSSISLDKEDGSPRYENDTQARNCSELRINERRVTFQSNDEEGHGSRSSSPDRREAIICTHFLKGKCSYGDKCFKIHPETGAGEGAGRRIQGDLRQRLERRSR